MTEELRALLSEQYGDALAGEIVTGYACTRPVTFRFNPLKISAEEGIKRLSACGISVRRARFYPDAFVAENVREDALRGTELFERGEIYLQSFSSMLPPLYLAPKAGETVLDMTAAPGGKTTELFALSGGKALITACERDKVRFERMRYNLARQGASRVTAMLADAAALDDAFSFDKILLDAPCTGSGTYSPQRPARFSLSYLEKCAAMQEKLLRKALRLLKKGGTMVYSTCSVLKRENEDVLERCLIHSSCRIEPVPSPEGVPLLPSGAGTLCVRPCELYEGFFLAKIIKE